MLTRRWLPLILLALPAAASAQTMNAEQFYQRSMTLQAKGPLAMFSRTEIKTLLGEVQRAGKASRERRLADQAAGRPPRLCPPSAQTSMGTSEFMKRLSAIPAAERAKIDMTEAMTRIGAARYPCPR